MTKNVVLVMLVSAAVFGCKKKDGDAGADKGGDSPKVAAADLPALTAEPAPAAITASDTPAFDSVKFRMTAKRAKSGWPEFDAYNLNTKPITFMAIYGYAYDKDGKQVARTKIPLSWNGEVPPGDKAMFTISVGDSDDMAPASATTFQLCYKSVSFKGDASSQQDPTRCPDSRPKS